MFFVEWLKWALSQTYIGIAVYFSGFFLLVALYVGDERDASYAIIPMLLTIPITIFCLYKHTTDLTQNPALQVKEVISIDDEEESGQNVMRATVVLYEGTHTATYSVSLYSPRSVSFKDLATIIESVRPCGAGRYSCRTPYGRITFKELRGTP